MPKLKVTITSTHTVTFNSGDIPANLIKELLVKNEGTFDGNWSIGDLQRDDKWTTESVEVEEVK